eukprot:1284115-Alexandrium_andersonii.AAC.1
MCIRDRRIARECGDCEHKDYVDALLDASYALDMRLPVGCDWSCGEALAVAAAVATGRPALRRRGRSGW